MRASAIVLAGAVLVAVTATTPAGAMNPKTTVSPVINIVATADQKFSPDHVVLHVKKRQTLRFTSAAGVHGIKSTELGIPSTMIMADKPVSVVVTPKKVGSYKVPCSIVCGANHADMVLTIEVKP
jgi:cytochrome c oxidase subunit 2